MAFCEKCGTQLADGDEFCGACGTPVAPEGASEAPIQATQPLPAPVPAPGVIPPPLPAPAAPAVVPRTKLGPLVILAVVLAVLLGLGCCGTAAVFGAKQLGFEIGGFGLSRPDSDGGGGSSEATSVAEDDASAGEDLSAETTPAEAEQEADDAADDGASGTLSMAESFDVLSAHYQRLWTLHKRIGLKNDAKPGGGTGFAYDDFNRNIGAGGKPQRQALAKRCEALLEEVDTAEQELIDAPIDPAYAEQQAKLLKLYGYLLARMRAMYDAAQIAIDSPAASAWRPALQPASGNAREAFEREYPKAKPTQL